MSSNFFYIRHRFATRLLHASLLVLLAGALITYFYGTPEIAWRASFGGWVTIGGAALLVVSAILFFCAPHTRYRQTLHSLRQDLTPDYEKYRVRPKKDAAASTSSLPLVALMLGLSLLAQPAHAIYYGQASRQVNHYWRLSDGQQYKDQNADDHLPTTVSPIVAEAFSRLFVYYDGRVCPFETMAIDFTQNLFDTRSYKGMTPTQVLLGFAFYTPEWEILRLRVPKDSADYQRQHALIEQAVSAQLFRIFPPLQPGETWSSWVEQTADSTDALAYRSNVMRTVVSQIAMGENAAAYETLRAFRAYQRECGAEYGIPSEARFSAEQWYIRYPILLPIVVLSLLSGLFFYIFFGVLLARSTRRRLPMALARTLTTIDVLLCLTLGLSLGLQTYMFGGLPWLLQNGLGTMAWGLLLLSVLLSLLLRRKPLRGILTALLTLIAAICLLLSYVCEWSLLYSFLFSLSAMFLLLSLYALLASLFGTNSDRLLLTMYHLAHLLLTPSQFLMVLIVALGHTWLGVLMLLVYAAPMHWHPAQQFSVPRRRLRLFHLYLVVVSAAVIVTLFFVV